jgi:chemotaxis protein CheC
MHRAVSKTSAKRRDGFGGLPRRLKGEEKMFGKKEDKMRDEMDMLREICSIASAHGSRALSEMLGKRINLVMPNMETMPTGKLAGNTIMNKVVVSVQEKMLNGIKGSILMLYEEGSAFELVRMCCPNEDSPANLLTELGFSALKEIGNVVMGSFAGAISIILKEPVVPSIPTLLNGPAKDIVEAAAATHGAKGLVIFVETCFSEEEKKVQGSLCFIIPEESFKKIQAACKRMLKELQ